MSNKVVEVKGFDELVKRIGKLNNMADEFYFPVHDAMGQSARLLEEQIKQNLTDNDSAGTGALRASIGGSEVQITKDAIFVEVGAGYGPGAAVPYAVYLENGTGPAVGRPAYTPPLSIAEPGQPLYEWVRVKGLAGTYNPKTMKRIGGKKIQTDQNRKVARAIWAKIRKEGTQPHPFFFRALEQKKAEIDKLFSTAIDKLLKLI